jgi:hypothetical protein
VLPISAVESPYGLPAALGALPRDALFPPVEPDEPALDGPSVAPFEAPPEALEPPLDELPRARDEFVVASWLPPLLDAE